MGMRAPGSPSAVVEIDARRYRCQRCNAVMLVVPCDLLPRKHYAASAIALAIALYGAAGLCAREVREAVSPWRIVGASATGWPALRRWVAQASSVWPCVRPAPAGWSCRQLAERVATTVAAQATRAAPILCAAFHGAARAR